MFSSWIRKLFQPRPSTIRNSAKSNRFRPTVEGLEVRTVPTFLAATTYAIGSSGGIAVGDFNSDEKSDLGVAHQTGTMSILISNGDGTFQPKVDYAAGSFPIDATAGDFNADGKLDLGVVGALGTVNVLFGNGDGSFGAPSNNLVWGGSHAIATADFY